MKGIGYAIWSLICDAHTKSNLELAKMAFNKNDMLLSSIFVENAEMWLNSLETSVKNTRAELEK